MKNIKGKDWTELYYILGGTKKEIKDVENLDDVYEQKIIEKLNSLENNVYIKLSKEQKEDIKNIRKFLKKLYHNDKNGSMGSYRFPLWKGLYLIEEDGTFIKYCRKLLTDMWY